MSHGVSPAPAPSHRPRRLLVDGVDRDTTTDAQLRELLADPSGGRLWLDLAAGDPGNPALLGEVFGVHPLAVEDADHFGQRPKVEDFDGYLYLVLFAAAGPDDPDRLAEIHLFYGERYLVTVHRDETPALEDARRAAAPRGGEARGGRLLYLVLDAIVDSFFPLLDEIDAAIGSVEEVLDGPDAGGGLHQRIFDMRRRLVSIRRVVAPARDQVARLASGSIPVPGMPEDGLRYMRDVEDHLIRITDTVDGYRDLLAGLTDVYLSTISNRLSLVMKQLAIVTVVFLPLTFLTGFFGQNFGWLVESVHGPAQFVALGIVLPIAAVLLLLVWFRRRRWL